MGTKKLRNPALYTRPTYRDLLARLAANTRRLREARGWTQAEAAEHCDMAVYVLQTVEGGRANFTGTVVARLCEGFEVDVRELFAPAAPLAKRKRGRPRNQEPSRTEEVAEDGASTSTGATRVRANTLTLGSTCIASSEPTKDCQTVAARCLTVDKTPESTIGRKDECPTE